MSAPPELDPLRLSNCPGCGYALEGLPPEGVCPECGGPYDQSEIVLHGYGTGQHGDVATARPRRAVALAALSAVILWWWIFNVMRNGVHDVCDVVWPVVIALGLAWDLWKRSTSNMPGLLQVRLSPRGALQIKNPTAGQRILGQPTPWSDIVQIHVRPSGPDTVRLKLVCRTTFWKGSRTAVDADVRCTQDQAEALSQRIGQWRAAVVVVVGSG